MVLEFTSVIRLPANPRAFHGFRAAAHRKIHLAFQWEKACGRLAPWLVQYGRLSSARRISKARCQDRSLPQGERGRASALTEASTSWQLTVERACCRPRRDYSGAG